MQAFDKIDERDEARDALLNLEDTTPVLHGRAEQLQRSLILALMSQTIRETADGADAFCQGAEILVYRIYALIPTLRKCC